MRSRSRGLLFVVFAAACVLTIAPGAAARVPHDRENFERHISLGRTSYEQGRNDDAIKEFKTAVSLRPNDSMAHLWLGRALGRKTEKAGSVHAAFLVGDVRKEFERAVALDPKNVEARSDLLEFYLDAPASFGGGLERAQRQAEAMGRLDPAAGHWARARIAEKKKRYDVAEHEYRAAAEAQPTNEEYQKDLNRFLNKHGPVRGKG